MYCLFILRLSQLLQVGPRWDHPNRKQEVPKKYPKPFLKQTIFMEEADTPLVDAPPQGLGLASIQENLLREREKLIHELGLDGGLQDQQKLSASSKAASKRGKVKKSTEPAPGPVMARRSLRCVHPPPLYTLKAPS